MAEVFLAKREGPGGFEKQLVIKRILPHLAASERFTSMFLKEARLAALVDHPNLVHVSSFGEIGGEYYLAMEYVDGFTLADFLQRTGVLSPGVAARIVVDVLEALYAIHTATNDEGEPLSLVHRDITPRNVMLTRGGAVKLLDFGIAMTAEDEGLSSMGTRRYMAPEQYDGTGIDHRADLFGAGVLLYLTITGSLPFPGRPVARATRHKRIPEGVWKALQPALELHAADRPADARAMQRPLELFVASRGIEGTRAHLAELTGSLAPAPSPAARMLSRLTQIGALTRRTGTIAEEAPSKRRRVAVLAGVGVAAVALGIGALYAAGGAGADPIRVAVNGHDAERAGDAAATGPDDREPGEAPRNDDDSTRDDAALLAEADAPARLDPAEERTVDATRTKSTPASSAEDATPKKSTRKKRTTGELTIDTTPWTNVYLGDKKLGMTPLVGVKLPAGKHRLRLSNPNAGTDETIGVTIRAGRTTRIRRTL